MSEEKARAAAENEVALADATRDPHDLVENNRGLKDPIIAVLTCMVVLARDAREGSGPSAAGENAPEARVDRSAVENAASRSWKDSYRHTPALTVDILVRNGALELTTLVNGEPYDGTLEDVQLDLSVPDDADAICDLTLTEFGREILRDYSPEVLLDSLLSRHPRYRPVFDAVLGACASREKCMRAELEDVVNGFDELTHGDEGNGQQTVYAQFFLDTLEEAGGIAWNDGWEITDAGRGLLEGSRAAA